jgi:hypothetical protein
MNTFGIFSFLTVIASVFSFLFFRGLNANLTLIIVILGSLSILGVVFAVISRKWLSGLMGIVLNGGVLVFVFFLLLAKGIGEN